MTLPWGAKLMTLECGMRFLTDYLDGDHYFKISRTHQNLDRARTQFTLVRQMEACWDEMVGASKEYLDAKISNHFAKGRKRIILKEKAKRGLVYAV